jgi:2,5-diamino-6-(ribosylamino)-4(3H)-pyrimidinone 5'-phosphate reductase
MLMSLDGKISTGESDKMDFDRDLPLIDGVKEGLRQYYDLERQTDPCSLNTGRVMAKIGINGPWQRPRMDGISFVILDNTHLTERGITNLANWAGKVHIATSNPDHPAYARPHPNLEIMFYDRPDPEVLMRDLKAKGIERVTIQSGGTMNAQFLRRGLIDYVSVCMAPVLIGGKSTPTLIDGEAPEDAFGPGGAKALELLEIKQLDHSYTYLMYRVLNQLRHTEKS